MDRHTTVAFFFQAEDGIRDRNVTGVQTCALPICPSARSTSATAVSGARVVYWGTTTVTPAPCSALAKGRPMSGGFKIGRASCRERVEIWGGEVLLKNQWRLERKVQLKTNANKRMK